jgi:hypothetical protein
MNLRHSFTWLILAAFIFEGAVSLAVIAVPAVLTPFSETHHAVRASSDQAIHSGRRHDIDDIIARRDQAQSREHVDDCLKCCQTCSIARIVPDAPPTPTRFSYASVSFSVGHDNLPDHFVALDPGIPKSSV